MLACAVQRKAWRSPPASQLSPATWLVKEITVTSSLAYFHEDFEMSMGMMAAGRIAVEPLHTSTIGLDHLEGMLGELAGGGSDQIKVLVDPRP